MKVLIISFIILLNSFYCFSQGTKKEALMDSIFSYVCEKGILHSDIVLKQVVLETGNLKSVYLMSKNNIFAFRKVNYMTFKSWRDCVDYYKKWQLKNYTNLQEDYYHFLVRIKYATAQYPIHLRKIKYYKTCS